MRQMIEASTPELPDDPTPEQCDAWIELSDILGDPSFVANMRANASEVWNEDFDHTNYARSSADMIAQARAAIEQGLAPTLRDRRPIGPGMAGNGCTGREAGAGSSLQDLAAAEIRGSWPPCCRGIGSSSPS